MTEELVAPKAIRSIARAMAGAGIDPHSKDGRAEVQSLLGFDPFTVSAVSKLKNVVGCSTNEVHFEDWLSDHLRRAREEHERSKSYMRAIVKQRMIKNRFRDIYPLVVALAKQAFDEFDDKGYWAAAILVLCEDYGWEPPDWAMSWLRNGVRAIAARAHDPGEAKSWLPTAFAIGGKKGPKKGRALFERNEIALEFAKAMVLDGSPATHSMMEVGEKLGKSFEKVRAEVYAYFSERPKGRSIKSVVYNKAVLRFIVSMSPLDEEQRSELLEKFENALTARGSKA